MPIKTDPINSPFFIKQCKNSEEPDPAFSGLAAKETEMNVPFTKQISINRQILFGALMLPSSQIMFAIEYIASTEVLFLFYELSYFAGS